MTILKIDITKSFTEVLSIKNVLNIGRGKENDLVLLDNSISRHHARIYKDQGLFLLEDINSANGVWVNDEKIIFRALHNNDIIKIGDCKITFSTEEVQTPTTTVDFRNHLSDSMLEQALQCCNVLFVFPSQAKIVEQIFEIATQKLETVNATEQERYQLSMAIGEAIGNAQRHGNKYDETKIIRFHYIHTPNQQIIFIVEDEGSGFDASQEIAHKCKLSTVQAAREIYKKGDLGGLGIKVMLGCMDKIEYNFDGNQITLTKFLNNISSKFVLP